MLVGVFLISSLLLSAYASIAVSTSFALSDFALSRIADQMTVISLVGFIGNLIGAIIFRIAKRYNQNGADVTLITRAE